MAIRRSQSTSAQAQHDKGIWAIKHHALILTLDGENLFDWVTEEKYAVMRKHFTLYNWELRTNFGHKFHIPK
jgi:hypothetical protein